MKIAQPKPLFDVVAEIKGPPSKLVSKYIENLQINEAKKEYLLTTKFLLNYIGSQDTYNAYRREVERLLQWAWLVKESNEGHRIGI